MSTEAIIILAIDPGPEHSAYCEWHNGIRATGWLPNDQLAALFIPGRTYVLESPQAQDRPFGKLFRDTVIWAGRYIEAITSRGLPLVEVDERDARTWIVGARTATNAALKQCLKNHFGDTIQAACACGTGRVPGKRPGTLKACAACKGTRLQTIPGPLARLNDHELSAVAVALYYEQKFLTPREGHGCLTQFSGTQGATE